MQEQGTSALETIRALYEQLRERLDESEDFRVARLLDFVWMKEAKEALPVHMDEETDPRGVIPAVVGLRDQLRARLEETEDFRVFMGLGSVLARESRLLPAVSSVRGTHVAGTEASSRDRRASVAASFPASASHEGADSMSGSNGSRAGQREALVEQLLEEFHARAAAS